MKLITNQQVAELITADDSIQAMREAFRTMDQGAQQARVRTSAAGVMLSTMGAIVPGAQVAGTKIYTTINGKFQFVIVLFSTETGQPLATIEADTMTAFRTAAATAVATDALASTDAETLSVIGTGVQARSHIEALLKIRGFKQILVSGRTIPNDFAKEIAAQTGVTTKAVVMQDAVTAADVLVTVTRAQTPLFAGELLPKGAFVAAVGASKATVRELDDAAIARAAAVVVEWKQQAQQEAGDLVMCAPGTFDWDKVWELGQALNGSMSYAAKPDDIVIYKSIGVGLEDIAMAGMVYRKASQKYGW
ncbi:ornithine cyclodeaminase family protein [Undibacterium sp.]|uniref:ornithine cyclodeaminase family protein n=1 Tax=Undibacterium sp. TaxID=1914977 RepID=UPI002BDCB211|nr:ornithine cyclodeaminase family protein [Undibacterium sp.]HTD05585.1 ornithine cyclodeaminase family protein [Undibacterium sp.]